ncbi:hypothetical protein [Streptomyces sp. NRRL F-5123]|uniref:hypothetical protein n=1 Tax=Streptomyces sp. NRRL F-5123 TaxID=1463856 RepID=UPI0006946384|nr:hypothetical protein [Streptomyces sp. NRRL F-5123]
MPNQRPIDRVLDDAVIPDAFPDFDLAASRRQIARDVADVLMYDNAATRAAGITRKTLRAPASHHPTLHTQAARDLYDLCAHIINGTHAGDYLAALDNSRQRIDPDGALYFACLLYLADVCDGAQFWWQFAAGGGNPTAAYCMYLTHVSRGELRDAQHWALQTSQLDELAEHGDYTHRIILALCAHNGRTRRPDPLLREAVQQLTVDPDDDFGAVPQPDPGLADRLEELAGAL